MKFDAIIEDIVSKIISTWNNRNFDGLKKYFVKNLVAYSPNITQIYPDNIEARLEGREQVLNYWYKLLEKKPFNIELIKYIEKGRKTITHCKYIEINQIVQFTIVLNEYGLIESVRVEPITK